MARELLTAFIYRGKPRDREKIPHIK